MPARDGASGDPERPLVPRLLSAARQRQSAGPTPSDRHECSSVSSAETTYRQSGERDGFDGRFREPTAARERRDE